MLNFITWNVEPAIFHIGSLEIRYYGLFWALSFYLSYTIVQKLIKKEGLEDKLMDPFFYAILLGTVLGARFGHVFFYDWNEYKDDLGSIFKIWEGGLASHGGAIGILIGAWWFARYRAKKSLLWVLDKLAIPAALSAALIRIGNFMNSEIIGDPTGTDYGVVFQQLGEAFPRHPAQLYEAVCYLLVLGLLWYLYHQKQAYLKEGKLFSIFLILVFVARFFVEYVKVSQGGFESSLGGGLSTGQWLSIPFILVGVFFYIRSNKNAQEKV